MLERLEIMKKKKEAMHKHHAEQIELKKFQLLELEMTVGCLKSQILSHHVLND